MARAKSSWNRLSWSTACRRFLLYLALLQLSGAEASLIAFGDSYSDTAQHGVNSIVPATLGTTQVSRFQAETCCKLNDYFEGRTARKATDTAGLLRQTAGLSQRLHTIKAASPTVLFILKQLQLLSVTCSTVMLLARRQLALQEQRAKSWSIHRMTICPTSSPFRCPTVCSR